MKVWVNTMSDNSFMPWNDLNNKDFIYIRICKYIFFIINSQKYYYHIELHHQIHACMLDETISFQNIRANQFLSTIWLKDEFTTCSWNTMPIPDPPSLAIDLKAVLA